MTNPQLKVEVGAALAAFTNRKTVSAKIIRLENGFDTGTIHFNDPEARDRAKFVQDDPINVYVKDASETSWYTLFKGVMRQITEGLGRDGESIEVKADGSGYGLSNCQVLEEYGSQSRNPTLDTLLEILTDGTHGVVPLWVNKILGQAANASGYNFNTDHVANIAGEIKYMYCPMKPASKVLCDLVDLMQAIKGVSAGPHWIVLPTDILLVQTIGAHDAGAAGHGWTNYINGQATATALATLIQSSKTIKGDFRDFAFQRVNQLANYILYHGAWLRPADMDKWTESNAADWICNVANTALANDPANPKQGLMSIQASIIVQAVNQYIEYPAARNLHLNLTAAGGLYSVPTFNFWMKRKANLTPDWLYLLFISDVATSKWYETDIDMAAFLPNPETWYNMTIPVGPNWRTATSTSNFSEYYQGVGGADWSDINSIRFIVDNKVVNSSFWVDGMCFAGFVLRGAKDGTSITAKKLKIKAIDDSYGKDDSLKATDDSGTLAQLAKAELYRARTEPILATCKTRMIKNALPGQLLHVHARPNALGTWNINKDFRVTQLVQSIFAEGVTTDWHVTDDLINAITRESYTSMNEVLKAIRPEYQDRQSSGIKIRDLDITQTLLELDYFP